MNPLPVTSRSASPDGPGGTRSPGLHFVIIMLPHVGHYIPTFKLAQDLIGRGHRVTYVGTDDTMRGHVVGRGFAFVRVELGAPPSDAAPPAGLSGWLRQARATLAAQRRLVDNLANGAAVGPVIEALAPDVLLLDNTLTAVAVALVRYGRPVVMLSAFLPLDRAEGCPPLDSWALPGTGLATRIRCRLDWAAVRFRRGLVNLMLAPIGLSEAQVLRRVARGGGVDLRGRLLPDRLFTTGIDLPEVILCPAALDFPRRLRPGAAHAGASLVQEPRDDTDGPGRPLVLVSLGTVDTRSRPYRQALAAALGAAREMPQADFVVVGLSATVIEGLDAPPNVRLLGFQPQAAWLGRAAVLVTHGGLGAIKEAIMAGVPMVVLAVPGADRYGNAARVAHHGLGLRVRAAAAEGKSVAAMIRTALVDPTLRQRVREMRDAFLAAERDTPAADIVERLASGCPAPRG